MSKLPKIILGTILGLVVIVVLSLLVVTRQISSSTQYVSNDMAGVSGGSAPVSFGLRESGTVAKNNLMVDTNIVTSQSTERLIIKTGNISLVVKDVRDTVAKITKYAADNNGFVVRSNVDKRDLALYGDVTIRIPANVFDSGVTEIKNMGEIKSEQVNGQDVTEEHTDLDAQLKNLQATESQFLLIMQKAVKIEDILAVQRELTVVRGQIESIQGRMKYLKQNAEMSTLTVQMSTDPTVLPVSNDQDKWKPWAEVKNAARSLIAVGQSLVDLVIWLVVYIPLWIVIVLMFLGARKIVRRRKFVG